MRARLLSPMALALAISVLAGCGGDDSASKAPKGSPENPLVAQPAGSSPAGGRSNEAEGGSNDGSPTIGDGGSGGTVGESGQQPGYKELLDRQARRPQRRFTPCNLVTRAQASAIVGARLREPLEAPQGPTCIYRSETGRAFVTVAVQTVNFSQLRPQLRQPRQVDLSGRTAYCGQYGQPMLYLPLSRGRVLTIAGECRVARRFAATALRQL